MNQKISIMKQAYLSNRFVSVYSRLEAVKNLTRYLNDNWDKLEEINEREVEALQDKYIPYDSIDKMSFARRDIDALIEDLEAYSTSNINGDIEENTDNIRMSGRMYTKIDFEPLGLVAVVADNDPLTLFRAIVMVNFSGNGQIIYYSKYMRKTMEFLLDAFNKAYNNKYDFPMFMATHLESDLSKILSSSEFDLVFPIGTKAFTDNCCNKARSPKIQPNNGPTHMYIGEFANEAKAVDLCFDARMADFKSGTSVSTILYHKNSEDTAIEVMKKFVHIRMPMYGCQHTHDEYNMPLASEKDFYVQYCEPCVNFKRVESVDEAVAHINEHGGRCVECIISESDEEKMVFHRGVQAACVVSNMSTSAVNGYIVKGSCDAGFASSGLHFNGPITVNDFQKPRYYIAGSNQRFRGKRIRR